MSYNYQAKVIFGFPLEAYPSLDFLGKDDEGCQVYLDEWLEKNNYRPLQQINAGKSNGGTPEFFVGVELYVVDDFTRATPYTKMARIAPSPKVRTTAILAALALNMKPKGVAEGIGIYLLGDRG